MNRRLPLAHPMTLLLVGIAVLGGSSASPVRGQDAKKNDAPVESPPETSEDRDRRTIQGMMGSAKFYAPSPAFSLLREGEVQKELGLTESQKQLALRLDELTRVTLFESCKRDMALVGSPQAEWNREISISENRRSEVKAGADQLLFTGILDRDQAEWLKRRVWRNMGPRALLQGEVAQRLDLSEEQRREVAKRSVESGEAHAKIERDLWMLVTNDNRKVADAAVKEVRTKTKAAEDRIGEVLTPKQAAMLKEIVATIPGPGTVPKMPRP